MEDVPPNPSEENWLAIDTVSTHTSQEIPPEQTIVRCIGASSPVKAVGNHSEDDLNVFLVKHSLEETEVTDSEYKSRECGDYVY